MKTTKKGFTLIELIVVIAIIGVLAAILVPSLLGYVKKSKIASVNSSASSVYKAINSALTELDEEGIDVGGLWILNWDGSEWSAADTTTTDKINSYVGTGKLFDKKVKNFFDDVGKIKKGECAIKSGSCVAVSICSDSTYTGTHPGGVVTTDTYDKFSDDNYTKALKNAIAIAGGAKPKDAEASSGIIAAPKDSDLAALYNGVGTSGSKSPATGG